MRIPEAGLPDAKAAKVSQKSQKDFRQGISFLRALAASFATFASGSPFPFMTRIQQPATAK
jgi:hypothetical protein